MNTSLVVVCLVGRISFDSSMLKWWPLARLVACFVLYLFICFCYVCWLVGWLFLFLKCFKFVFFFLRFQFNSVDLLIFFTGFLSPSLSLSVCMHFSPSSFECCSNWSTYTHTHTQIIFLFIWRFMCCVYVFSASTSIPSFPAFFHRWLFASFVALYTHMKYWTKVEADARTILWLFTTGYYPVQTFE